jgi:hypothetical protein
MKTYWVTSEGGGFLNPGERPFRKLERAEALALKEMTDCSWKCLTPPGQDNDRGRGNFLCGALSPHGIHIRTSEDGYWTEEYDVLEEEFQKVKAGPHVDWTLEVIIDRGTDALADGHDVQYFTGPEQAETGWDLILDGIADGDEVVEATVRIAPQGRYTHQAEDYPLTWRPGYGF